MFEHATGVKKSVNEVNKISGDMKKKKKKRRPRNSPNDGCAAYFNQSMIAITTS